MANNRIVLSIGTLSFALALFSGCKSQTVNTTDPAFSNANPTNVTIDQVETDSSLSNKAGILGVRESRTPGGLLRIQAEIFNSTNKRQEVNYRVDWFDQDGIVIDSPMSSWKRISLAGKDTQPITATAPSPNAADFRIKLVEPGS
ncbi:MAG: YcfL family protein [Opitutales bacterium]